MGSDRLVVLNKDDDTMSIIDIESGAQREHIETAFNPHEVIVGPEGDTIYVTCSLGDTLIAYDTENWERRHEIADEQFEFPHGLAIHNRSNELWLASTYANRLFVYDLATLEHLDTIPTHQDKSHMIAIDEADDRAYIANIGSDNVTVIDCETRSIDADPRVGEGPEGIAIDPEAGVLVANQDDNYLSVLDPETLEEQSRAMLGETPIRVVRSPTDRLALVPNRESNTVSVIDLDFERDGEHQPWETARIPVGIWPGGTVFSPDGETAYVANNKSNDVSVIDVSASREIERLPAGTHPDGIAYLPD